MSLTGGEADELLLQVELLDLLGSPLNDIPCPLSAASMRDLLGGLLAINGWLVVGLNRFALR